MIKHAIEHKVIPKYIYPSERNSIVFRIKTAREDIIRCKLIYWPRTKTSVSDRKESDMICRQRDELFDYYQTTIKFKKAARYTKYYFELTDTQGKISWITAYGIKENVPKDGYFEYLYANDNDIIRIPDWVKGKIFYQIFPERYKNGDKSNDPPNIVAWDTYPTRENFFGGDISGIIQQLDYIKSLDIDCIYLNPIFKADFNHKYATTDYFIVDSSFGTNDELKELVSQCHKRNIKLILDGVFNHCGVNFEPFRDLLINQEKSKYKDWFYVTHYPVSISHHNYECVGAYKWMPKLKSSNPEVRKYILDIMEYWIREAGIDGWRLDVADEVDSRVWQYARTELKVKYPNIILIGETWGNASKMLAGDQMDSAMNYVLRDAVKDFFAKGNITPQEFDARINSMLAEYYDEVNYGMYNLISSHDTPRFLFECNNNKQKFKLAVAFQLMFCGCPAIYYGDEIGMTGDNDPDCRGGMVWNEKNQDPDLLNWYKQLIQLRKKLLPLQRGSYISNLCDNTTNTYGFIREINSERVYVVLNNSNDVHEVVLPIIESKSFFEDCLTKESFFGKAINSIVKESFYNQDLLEYSKILKFTMQEYSIKIIKLKMEE